MQPITRKSFVALLAMVAFGLFGLRPGVAQTIYTLTDLGTVPNGTGSQAMALNNNGYVVGVASTFYYNQYNAPVQHAFLWSPTIPNGTVGTIQDLSNSANVFGGWNSLALAINNSNQVVGQADVRGGGTTGFLWDGVNGMRSLGITSANGINNSAWIVGKVGSYGVLKQGLYGANTLLGFYPNGINDSGWMVGNNGSHAVLATTPYGAQDFGTFGGSVSNAYAINASGQTVGQAATVSGAVHAFRHSGGGTLSSGDDLGVLGGTDSVAYGINSSGQVVGWTNGHAFVYIGSGPMLDLNSLLPLNSGWTLREARGINATGQIVGWGLNPSGQAHAFLLTRLSPVNVSGQVSYTKSFLRFLWQLGIATQTITITNISSRPIAGPIQVVLTNMASGVNALHSNGTYNGSPYYTLNRSLLPGSSVSLTVSFDDDPGNYGVQTFSGSFL